MGRCRNACPPRMVVTGGAWTLWRPFPEMQQVIKQKYPRHADESEKKYEGRIRSKWIDNCRYLLPTATLAAQCLGAIPVPLYQDAASTEYAFPINNAEVAFAVVEDQEQVDKMLELRQPCPQLTRIWFDDPRGLRNYDEPGLGSLDALVDMAQLAGLQTRSHAPMAVVLPGERHAHGGTCGGVLALANSQQRSLYRGSLLGHRRHDLDTRRKA
mgnify:CR=1 FL=1